MLVFGEKEPAAAPVASQPESLADITAAIREGWNNPSHRWAVGRSKRDNYESLLSVSWLDRDLTFFVGLELNRGQCVAYVGRLEFDHEFSCWLHDQASKLLAVRERAETEQLRKQAAETLRRRLGLMTN